MGDTGEALKRISELVASVGRDMSSSIRRAVEERGAPAPRPLPRRGTGSRRGRAPRPLPREGGA